jgi:membrane protease YdiL (CAAX protease family)
MYSTKRGNKFILIILLLMLVGSRAIGFIIHKLQIPLNESSLILIPQLLFLTVPIILYFIITKASVKETLLLNRLDGINILLTIGIGIFIQPFMGLVNLISQLFFENKVTDTISSLTSFPLWLLLLLVAVLPAINEEIITRGILLSNYKNTTIMKAALVSGLCFGMLHLNGNQFSYAFFMGIVLSFLVKITGSIYSSMLVHFLINGLQMCLLKFSILMQDLAENYVDYDILANQTITKSTILSLIIPSLMLTLVTLPLVYLFFRLAIKYNNKQELFKKATDEIPNNIQKQEKIFDGYLITSVILFIGFVFINEILPSLL